MVSHAEVLKKMFEERNEQVNNKTSKETKENVHYCDCGYVNRNECCCDDDLEEKLEKPYVVIETKYAQEFEDSLNYYSNQGYDVCTMSCDRGKYKAILEIAIDTDDIDEEDLAEFLSSL